MDLKKESQKTESYRSCLSVTSTGKVEDAALSRVNSLQVQSVRLDVRMQVIVVKQNNSPLDLLLPHILHQALAEQKRLSHPFQLIQTWRNGKLGLHKPYNKLISINWFLNLPEKICSVLLYRLWQRTNTVSTCITALRFHSPMKNSIRDIEFIDGELSMVDRAALLRSDLDLISTAYQSHV